MWLSAALDLAIVFAVGIVWPSVIYLKGPSWNLVDLSAGLTLLDQVWFAGTKETGLPCGLQCGEETLVRTGKGPYSSHASLSPLSSFCTHSSSCCTSVCDTNAAEATGTEKTGASSSQPVLSSGMAGQRNTKERIRTLGNFLSPCVSGRKSAQEFTFCREIL